MFIGTDPQPAAGRYLRPRSCNPELGAGAGHFGAVGRRRLLHQCLGILRFPDTGHRHDRLAVAQAQLRDDADHPRFRAGHVMEINLRNALAISGGDVSILFQSPNLDCSLDSCRSLGGFAGLGRLRSKAKNGRTAPHAGCHSSASKPILPQICQMYCEISCWTRS